MKSVTIIMAAALTICGLSAQADTVISSRTVKVPVDLNSSSVVFTNAGYSSHMVKILVPALAEPTIMDHRNYGEASPCLATVDTRNIEDVLQGQPGAIEADMQITLSKTATLGADDLCEVELREHIETTIRGFVFTHDRYHAMPSRHADDCR